MSWVPTRPDWQRTLPPGLLWFIAHRLKRSLVDLIEVMVEARDEFSPFTEWAKAIHLPRAIPVSHQLTWTLSFVGGQRTQIVLYTDVWQPPLIGRYADVLLPGEWIHRIILEAPESEPVPDYSDPNQAFRVLACLVRRVETDALLVAFAGLLQANDHLEPHELVPVLRMMCLAPPWTPQQICTAAYHAYLDVRKEEYHL